MCPTQWHTHTHEYTNQTALKCRIISYYFIFLPVNGPYKWLTTRWHCITCVLFRNKLLKYSYRWRALQCITVYFQLSVWMIWMNTGHTGKARLDQCSLYFFVFVSIDECSTTLTPLHFRPSQRHTILPYHIGLSSFQFNSINMRSCDDSSTEQSTQPTQFSKIKSSKCMNTKHDGC